MRRLFAAVREYMKAEDPTGAKKRRRRRLSVVLGMLLVAAFVLSGCVSQSEIDAARQQAIDEGAIIPSVDQVLDEDTQIADGGDGEEGIFETVAGMLGSRSQSVQVIGLLTILSLAPSILIMLTSFVRIVIVLSFVRNAIGVQQMPPNQVMVGLALFLTFFVMSPVIEEIKTEAYIPYAAEIIEFDEAAERAEVPLKRFMLRQTRTSDLEMFCSFSGTPMPASEEELMELSMSTIIPSYLTSELRRGFEMGFLLYIPFIVIDMIVASTLMAMGMMMLPPITISLPFKVLLFVIVDGWALTMQSLVAGFL